MKDSLISKSSERKGRLINIYRKSAQFGLVLGAGVTVKSNVPDYNELAYRLLERIAEQPQFVEAESWMKNLADFQRKQLEDKRETIPPDALILYVRRQFGDDKDSFRELVRQEMYKDVAVDVTASQEVFEINKTLDSILSFCAARPGGILSPGKSEYKVEPNIKIGGILTTNYDNLVESAFHTKYRRNLLKPVGRPSTNEFEKKEGRTIPVYHIHGYVGFKAVKKEEENPDIIIAEDNYFDTFYDPLGFGNYVAMSFLRRFPMLIIGSRMTDKNLRRFLYHLYKDTRGNIPEHQKKFAILPFEDPPVDTFMDEVLLDYGVETIWIDCFDKIPRILREMYVNSGGRNMVETLNNDWENLPRVVRAKKKIRTKDNNPSNTIPPSTAH